MIEAYELEANVATYPRIAVSRKLYSQMNSPMILLNDRDGITHFDYFQRMIWAGGWPGDDGFKERLNEWLNEARRMIADNIQRFEQEERWNELAKWVWFRNHLEQAHAAMPKGIFD